VIICGQKFSQRLINRIQDTITKHPDISRCQLSRQICHWLDWRRPNGAWSEVSCRLALLKLHRRGFIHLPAAHPISNFHSHKKKRPIHLKKIPQIECRLSELGSIKMVPINGANRQESRIWNVLFEDAVEKLDWYTLRYCIEVYHRTLKSGCKIEQRQLGHADRIESCLAIDMVVAWRIFYLTKLGRETPDAPCTIFFEEAEWKALVADKTQNPRPPEKPPLACLGLWQGRPRFVRPFIWLPVWAAFQDETDYCSLITDPCPSSNKNSRSLI